MSDSWFSSAALGTIAGELSVLNDRLFIDRMFAGFEMNRIVAQRMEQVRAEWAGAYNELRNIALKLDAKVARLEADLAQKDLEISQRDVVTVDKDQAIFDRDGKIHDLESKVAGLQRRWGILMDAVTDYRSRLGIVFDEYDGGTL